MLNFQRHNQACVVAPDVVTYSQNEQICTMYGIDYHNHSVARRVSSSTG